MEEKGLLYICPTPIGNLEDITLRALNTLKSVDIIAAEDTRHTIKLLNHYNIKKPLFSYHEHNKSEKGEIIIDKIIQGESIALVSDAGMPGISDPGEDLVKLAIEMGIKIIALPGATALITALVTSGLSTEKFVFEGFLSSNSGEKLKRLEELKIEKRTLIFYEAPHRLKSTLKDMEKVFGQRKISIARELTKKYEEIFRGYIHEALDRFDEKVKGEIVIVVEGISEEEIKSVKYQEWEGISIKEHILFYMNKGFTKKQAVKKVSVDRDIPKNDIYRESIDIEI